MFAATGAPRVTTDELTVLIEGVRAVADEYGYPVTPGRDAARGFDRTLAGVYLEDGRLFPAEASSQEVWSFHALVLFPDVAYWRFRSESGDTNKERLVGSDLTRHAFGRLWWRALVLCTTPDGGIDEDGLKRLDVFGEADIDQIQSRRKAYGFSPAVFQALTDLWEQEAEVRLEAKSIPRRDGLRDLLKRLLRLGAYVSFDLLEPEQLEGGLRQALDETVDGLTANAGQTNTVDSKNSLDGSAPTEPDALPNDFDDVSLALLPRLVTELVRTRTSVRGRNLVAAFEEEYEISVPANREKILNRFAWVAAGLGYLTHEKQGDEWHVGETRPADDRRWGDWSINSLRVRAGELGRTGVPNEVEVLTGELFEGPRPSKLARHLVHIVLEEVGDANLVDRS